MRWMSDEEYTKGLIVGSLLSGAIIFFCWLVFG